MKTPRPLLFGVFFLSSAMLLLEILLTRIFSVMMYYHFAFLVISTVLFGMGAAAIQIYLRPQWFPPSRVPILLPIFAAGFAVMAVVSFLIQSEIPSYPGFHLFGVLHLALTYVVVSIPFFLGGGAIALVLTNFARGVSVIYSADLLGASLGCALVYPLLRQAAATDLIFFVSLLGLASAFSFSLLGRVRPLRAGIVSLFLVCAALFGWSTAREYPLLPAGSVGENGRMPFAYRWSPMGRVLAYDFGRRPQAFPGRADSVFHADEKWIRIDNSAQTHVARFDGDFRKVRWLLADISALPLHLRPGAKILDIGSGGGELALASLALGTRDYTGVEINPSIVTLVREDLREYSGGIYQQPGVRVFVGDGRTYAARSKERYGLITFVSSYTVTATTAGAFMMAENNLFTQEAFRTYYDLLQDDGIISVSQIMTEDYPGLMLRGVELCRATLEAKGIADARRHLLIAMAGGGNYGTLLLKKSPFTKADLDRVEELCREMNWRVLLSPRESHHSMAEAVAGGGAETCARTLGMNLRATQDDQPFFFNLVPFRHVLSTQVGPYALKYGKSPAQVLLVLLGIAFTLTLVFILLPQFSRAGAVRPRFNLTLPTLLFFVSIGLGYIMVEIPFTQQFVLYLGHPIHALTVVLFSLLLFSGLGSLSTGRVSPEEAPLALSRTLIAVLVVLVLMISGLPRVFGATQGLPQAGKVLVSVLLLLPLGLLMGRPFALCLKSVATVTPAEVPWCWGVNGAASVLGSVLSVIFSISQGFRFTLWIGAFAYAAALVFFLVRARALGTARVEENAAAGATVRQTVEVMK